MTARSLPGGRTKSPPPRLLLSLIWFSFCADLVNLHGRKDVLLPSSIRLQLFSLPGASHICSCLATGRGQEGNERKGENNCLSLLLDLAGRERKIEREDGYLRKPI